MDKCLTCKYRRLLSRSDKMTKANSFCDYLRIKGELRWCKAGDGCTVYISKEVGK